MFTVSIAQVKKRAPVGLFAQESLTGNHLVFDIAVGLPASIYELPEIDYGTLYNFIDNALTEPAQLLETILQRIVFQVQENFPQAKLKVTVTKLRPPLGGEPGEASVSWEN